MTLILLRVVVTQCGKLETCELLCSIAPHLTLHWNFVQGEDWNAAMFDAIKTNGAGAAVFFISLIIIGGYIMLNLFLAVLLVKTADAFEKPTEMRKEKYCTGGVAVQEDRRLEPEGEYDRLEGSALFCLGPKNNLRLTLRDLCRNQNFDNFILACILISSAALAVEEPGQDESVLQLIDTLDLIFTIAFISEMLLKIATLNFIFGAKNAYLRNPWNVLDFFVVMASILSRVVDDNVSWIKSLRVLRALRPLRVIKRVPELKQVVNSLFRAIPIISNVLALLAMFWLIFAILGVQLFKGKFYSCTDADVTLESECTGQFEAEGVNATREWVPPEWGFDNIVQAMLTLFEVSTLERWLDIMYLCIDATEVGKAPEENFTPAVGIFFITFIMFGSFFMLELFVSAIVAAYTLMNEETDGSAFQSERQKRIIGNMVLNQREDDWTPQYAWQMPLFQILLVPHFENAVIVCIVLNMLVMALYFDGMDARFADELDLWNAFFTFIFLAECIFKMAALSPARYFNGPSKGWNRFDFFLVVVTTSEFVFSQIASDSDDIPGIDTLRVFRIARIFRLFAKFKGLTNLFLAIVQALPTIMNVGAVLFLLFFIYAVLGMNLFGRVKRGEFVDDRTNFETFGVALLTVFRMTTGESWNGIMMDCRVREPDCDPDIEHLGGVGNCGSYYFAPIYFVSFQLFGQYVMLNLFVAVMIEFYQRQQDATDQFLSSKDREIFETEWIKFVGREHKPPHFKACASRAFCPVLCSM